MGHTYVVMHLGKLLAVYNNKADVVDSIRNIAEQYQWSLHAILKYSVFELSETAPESEIYMAPKALDVMKLSTEKP